MAWVRFPIWDRWKDTTRFWIAGEGALLADYNRWESLPLKNIEQAIVEDSIGRTKFKCKVSEYIETLKNTNYFYGMILVSYIGLTEAHSRNIIEYMVDQKSVPREKFAGMNKTLLVEVAAREYVRNKPVEQWGKAILHVGQLDWSSLPGGEMGIIETFVARNIIAHGDIYQNTIGFNRLENVNRGAARWKVGDMVLVDRDLLIKFVQNLRAFCRKIGDVAANI